MTAAPTAAAADSLTDLLHSLVLYFPGSGDVVVDHVDEVCEREGYPKELSAKAAADLGDMAPGETVVVVHPDGQTRAKIVAAGCSAPEEYVPAATHLTIDPPVGESSSMYARPYLAFIGATPHPDATLRPATPGTYSMQGLSRTVEHAFAFAEARVAECRRDEDAPALPEPTLDSVGAALNTSTPITINSADQKLLFTVISHQAITPVCYENEDPDLIGVLFDLEAPDPLLTFQTNNGIEPQWLTDLDGDATEELILDLTWLEDGGQIIYALHRTAQKWDHYPLYEADGP